MSEPMPLELLAKKHGHYKAAPVAGDSPFSAAHAVADVLHQWSRAELESGVSVKLADADYLAALEAGTAGAIHEAADRRSEAEIERFAKKAARKEDESKTKGPL